MYCKSCGMLMSEITDTCSFCGTEVGDGSTFCASCGSVRHIEMDHCPECGSVFSDQDVVFAMPDHHTGDKQTTGSEDVTAVSRGNITGIIGKSGYPDIIFDYGPYFLSVVILILSFLPCVNIYTDLEQSVSGIFSITFLGGFLIILAFLLSVARLVPAINNIITEKPRIRRYYILTVPTFQSISVVILFLHLFFGSVIPDADGSRTLYSLTLAGWILLFLIIICMSLALISVWRQIKNK